MEKEIEKIYLNPEQIVKITVCDAVPCKNSSIYSIEIIKVDTRSWHTKLFHHNSTPKYEYRIKKRVLRHNEIFTFEEFFNDPENQEAYLYPVIQDGVLLNNTLLLKPSVLLYCSNGEKYRACFENESDRDDWLVRTGLDKVTDKFIKKTDLYI